ncbi:MAG: polynucleotide kinase-phosphatase, partial [Chloroflexota bacterium]
GKIRSFALYGDTTGERDEYDLPVRLNWAADYRGQAMVVYGHTPVFNAEWLNNTINLDTGCVFGGKLSALRLPEQQLVSVPAKHEYAVSKRPLIPKEQEASAQQEYDDILNIGDVTGKRFVNTRLRPNITLREENSIAALEVMSRFAVDPKWLIYLPPTMSPTETSDLPDFLEHPTQAFDYFRASGVKTAVCEEKHMGSRAVVIVCQDESVPKQRFGVDETSLGIVYTRTGRRFFDDLGLEQNMLQRVSNALTDTGFWDAFETNWVCLDCELMPWSTKAQGLLEDQYAAVGASATAAMAMTTAVLQQAQTSGAPVDELVTQFQPRAEAVSGYISAYQQYCWPVVTLEDLRLAPFHLLAAETAVFVDKTHQWHMEMIAKHLCATPDPILQMTNYKLVNLEDEGEVETAVKWWHGMTEKGSEGMVVKPLDFVVTGIKGLIQPAVKCRGAEYLRIIYGPEYNLPDNIKHLRSRRVGHKRSMAVREFALGVEGLERFVRHEPLRKVHECVFGVLAMESEPVDPRL